MACFQPRAILSLAAICLLALLADCGGPMYPSVNGTWSLYAISTQLPSEPPQTMAGTMSSSGSSASATLTFSNACFKGQKLTYSGSIGDENILKLTSNVYNNQIVFLTGTLSSDGSLLTQGSYTVSANNTSQKICDTGDAGSLSGSRTSTTQVAQRE